ncbi:MAG: alpha/beta fold hydrolase [Pseudomonadota bacterium]
MSYIPNLEPRFLAPKGWKTDHFENSNTGHTLHFGYSTPDSPKGVVILLQGLQEFSEKYYETANHILDQGHAIAILEWQYQGRSGRLKDFPQRRHSDGFETDIDDLKVFIDDYISKIFPNQKRYMLAHSTGGLIGLRYLSLYPNDFVAASFSAPLIGIYGLNTLPNAPIQALAKALAKTFPKRYVLGGRDWNESERKSDGSDKFSSDPIRDSVTNSWYIADSSLQGGSPTNNWLYQALRSMKTIKKQDVVDKIVTPCLFGIAENDTIVCSKESEKLAKRIQNADILNLKNAKHEILMETDDVRNLFFNKTLELFQKHA